MYEKINLSLNQLKLDEDLLKSGLYFYKAKIRFIANEVNLQIFLSGTQQDNLNNYIGEIETQVNWLQSHMDYVEGEIRQSHLIELKNDNWLEEGEDKITPNQFMDRITLLAVSINIIDGKLADINLEYDDDDIFWGHRISVSIVDGKVIDVEM